MESVLLIVTFTGAISVPIPTLPVNTLLESTFKFPSTLRLLLKDTSPTVVNVLFNVVAPFTLRAWFNEASPLATNVPFDVSVFRLRLPSMVILPFNEMSSVTDNESFIVVNPSTVKVLFIETSFSAINTPPILRLPSILTSLLNDASLPTFNLLLNDTSPVANNLPFKLISPLFN